MTISCPVCRANNESGSNCRRCKADLAPLFDLEARRAQALAQVAQAAALGDGPAVLRHARAAMLLRAGNDAQRWLACGFLLQREFGRAVSAYRLAECTEAL